MKENVSGCFFSEHSVNVKNCCEVFLCAVMMYTLGVVLILDTACTGMYLCKSFFLQRKINNIRLSEEQ